MLLTYSRTHRHFFVRATSEGGAMPTVLSSGTDRFAEALAKFCPAPFFAVLSNPRGTHAFNLSFVMHISSAPLRRLEDVPGTTRRLLSCEEFLRCAGLEVHEPCPDCLDFCFSFWRPAHEPPRSLHVFGDHGKKEGTGRLRAFGFLREP